MGLSRTELYLIAKKDGCTSISISMAQRDWGSTWQAGKLEEGRSHLSFLPYCLREASFARPAPRPPRINRPQ